MAKPKSAKVELRSDGWERFQHAVDAAVYDPRCCGGVLLRLKTQRTVVSASVSSQVRPAASTSLPPFFPASTPSGS